MPLTRSRSLLCLLTLSLMSTPALAQEAKAADAKRIVAEARDSLQQGNFEAAAASFKKAVQVAPDNGTAWQLLGYSLHAMGKLDDALPVHKKAAEFPAVAAVASYNVACVYALQGAKEKALTWLEKSADAGFDRPEHVAGDPDMESLREDERFAAIMKKIKSHAGAAPVQPFVIESDRKSARVAWFGRNGSPGQLAIDYTPVSWQGKYNEMIDSEKMIGRKWRLGGDFWTTLDTSVDMKFGYTDVPAGYYYLTLTQSEPGKFVLGVHDAGEVRKQRLDASGANRLGDGFVVALAHDTAKTTAQQLSLGIELEAGSTDSGEFAIRFGGHRLTAPVQMHLGKKKQKKSKPSKY